MRARITAQSNEIEMTLYTQLGMGMILCFVKRENSVREDCCQHVNIRTDGLGGRDERFIKSQRDDGSLTHAAKIQAAHTH